MTDVTSCFFAYSASPEDLSETIDLAIDEINRVGKSFVNITGWKHLRPTGSLIINEVCKAIDECTIFVCDLTTLSTNVLFELGYAIAKNKRIWITLNSSYKDVTHHYKKLSLLSTVGYASYGNSYELRDKFLEEQPYTDLSSTIYDDIFKAIVENHRTESGLFYLKCGINTDASVQLTRKLNESQLEIIVDDPDEVPIQSIEWYAQNIFQAYAVVAQFAGENHAIESSTIRNGKHSLIAGLAYGFEKPILMLAHAPFQPPVDYRHLLQIHKTARECTAIINEWLPDIEVDYLADRAKAKEVQRSIKAAVDLRHISLGQYIAENEEKGLSDYFVVTAPYNDALRANQYLLYVGRKGTGKTANLYQIKEELLSDKRNHVCVIKPVDYELEGVLQLLKSNLSKANPGYLSESLWKYLIYTELAVSVSNEIRARPPHVPLSDEESEFMDYLEKNRELILTDFTERMEHVIEDLCKVDLHSVREQRAKVSEILHISLLSNLREVLGKVLDERHKVYILVDNLDKAWKHREDLKLLADFLYGLLGAAKTASEEFQRHRETFVVWRSVNLSLIVFLRSDIFAYVLGQAREADKVAHHTIDWNDSRLLQRVIEERFSHSLGGSLSGDDVWRRYFVPTVKGIETKEYIISRIIPRPRDMIHFCTHALTHAINHSNTIIGEEDILQAETNYSEHAFNSLLVELEAHIPRAEELLYEFAGAPNIVTDDQIAEFVENAGIPKAEVKSIIKVLSEYTFLGLETSDGNFEYLYEERRKPVLQKLASRVVDTQGHQRFRINEPFHRFLAIE